MKQLLIVSTFAIWVWFLEGCSSAPKEPDPPPAKDPVEERLKAALENAAAQRPITAEVQRPKPVYGWDATTVDYAGDVVPLIQEIAQGMGMRALVTGPQPALPIFVRIRAEREKLEDVLYRVAEQLGGRADIILRDTSIEIRYKQ